MAADYQEVLRLVIKQEGGSEIGTIAQSLLDAAKAGDIAGTQFEEAAAALQKLSQQQGAINTFTKLKASLTEVSVALAAAKVKQTELTAAVTGADKPTGVVSAAYAKVNKEVTSLTDKQAKLQAAFNAASAGLTKAGVDSNNLAAAQAKITNSSNAVAKSIADVGQKANATGTFSEKLVATFSKLGTSLSAVKVNIDGFVTGLLRVTGIAGGVAAALGALNVGRFFGNAVSSAKDFEATLSEVQAVSGATADELKQMRQAAEDASKTTKFSAQEAAGALGELARASGSASDAISELPATLNLAQGAGLAAADAATILTTAITQFGLSAADATRVSDLFAQEANSTNDTVQGLGNSLSYVAPLAKQLGISIEDTTATLGALAEQGFRGERAGTALRNVFSQLLDPTSNFRDALNGLGIKGNDFTQIVTKLAAAGDKGKAALLALDSEARPAISALVSSGGAGIKRLTEDFKNSAGAAQLLATSMGQNFEGASSRLVNAFDSLRRSLVDPILQPLAGQFDAVAVRIRAFAESTDFARIKEAVKTFALEATDAIVKFVGAIDFTQVSRSLENFSASAKEFFGSIKTSGESTFTALGVAANSVSLIFNGIKSAVQLAAAGITQAFILVAEKILGTLEVLAKIPGAYDKLKPSIDSVKESIAGLQGVQEEFNKRAAANADNTKKAFDRLTAGVQSTAPALNAAAKANANLADKQGITAEAAAELAQTYLSLSPALQKIVEPSLRAAGVFSKIAEAAPEAAKGADQAADALKKAQVAASAAYNDVNRFAGAGDTTSAAYLKAKAALDQANAAVAILTGKSLEAAAASTALAAAQARLGKTHEQLAADAAQAGADLDVLYQSFLKGTSAIEDVRAEFEKYAAAQRASVANSDSWKQSQVEDLLAVKAAALGLGDIKPPDYSGPTKGLRDYGTATGDTTQKTEQLKSSYEEASDAIEKASAVTESHRGHLQDIQVDLSQFSKAALRAYAEVEEAAFKYGLSNEADGIVITNAINAGNARITAQIAAGQAQVQSYVDNYAALTDAQLDSISKQQGGLDGLLGSINAVADAAKNGTGDFALLNDADLSRLIASAEQAAQRVAQIQQRAESATQSLNDLASSLQDQVDQSNGDQVSIENRRFQKQLDDIKAQAELAGVLGRSAADEAENLAEKVHQQNLANIAAEAEAKKKSDEEAAARNSAQNSTTSDTTDAGSQPGTEANRKTSTVEHIVNVPDLTVGGKKLSQFTKADAEELARLIASSPSAANMLVNSMVQVLQTARKNAAG